MRHVRTQPVKFWAVIQSAAMAFVGLLAGFGVVEWTAEQQGLVLGFFASVGVIFSFVVAGRVTPTDNPRDDAGRPLTPDQLPPV